MALTRCAKRSVLSVSARLAAAGLTLAIMMVLALPPSESCSPAGPLAAGATEVPAGETCLARSGQLGSWVPRGLLVGQQGMQYAGSRRIVPAQRYHGGFGSQEETENDVDIRG